MNMQKRLFGGCSVYLPEKDEIIFDLDSFVRRFLLFDTYILESTKLKEFRHLINAFGFDGVIQLLNTGAIRIFCYAMSIGQITQMKNLRFSKIKNSNIIGPYYFDIVKEHPSYREKNMGLHFKKEIDLIESINLKQRIKLKNKIVANLESIPENYGKETLEDFLKSLKANSHIIISSLIEFVRNKKGKTLNEKDFFIKVNQEEEKKFVIETNLGTILNINDKEVDYILQKGILGISSVSRRIEEMKAFSALLGYSDEDKNIFSEKIFSLEGCYSSLKQEKRFKRIIALKGFPNIGKLNANISIKKLIKIRESKECSQFRDWLPNIDSENDIDLISRFESLLEKIREHFHCPTGEVLRFLIYSGLGIVSSQAEIMSVGLSALDIFLISKILPKSGPMFFINKLYPSIYIE